MRLTIKEAKILNQRINDASPYGEEVSEALDAMVQRLIGQRLTQIRVEWNWTVRMTGRAAGVSGQQICKYESGENRIPAHTIVRLLSIAKCTPAYFYRPVFVTLDWVLQNRIWEKCSLAKILLGAENAETNTTERPAGRTTEHTDYPRAE